MSEPEIRFVPFLKEHLDAILDIEKEAYPEPWTPGMFEDELHSSLSCFYVMLSGDEIIGYGGFWLVLDEAHITSVTVAKAHRGLGYGRILLRFLFEIAADRGVRTATLEVRASNHIAQRLYESEGFRAVGIRKNYYSRTGEDAILMTCTFDPGVSA